MTPRAPDFDELVGTDLEGAERERLRRVHELLVAAGPPPELSVDLGAAPAPVSRLATRPRRALLALAAALGIVVFAVGYVAGVRGGEPGTFESATMAGVGTAAEASAVLEIFDIDEAGNWPMEVRVEGLRPPTSGKLYEVWLTRDGELAALCGSFLAEPDGTTVVPMNAPYRLSDYDGWVVVEQGSETPLLTT